MGIQKEGNDLMRTLVASIMILLLCALTCRAETGMASFFSNRETGGKNCADGKYHDLSSEMVLASWRYKLGSFVRISTMDGRSIICRVVDRGPGRKDGTSRFYKGTRIADLSLATFSKLSPLSAGVIKISIERLDD